MSFVDTTDRVPALAAAVRAAIGATVVLLAGCSYRIDKVDNPVKLPVVWNTPAIDPNAAGTAVPGANGAAAAPATPAAPAGATAAGQFDVGEFNKDWWRGFGSPVLTQLLDQALQANPSLKVTEERLKQTERSLEQARNDLLPDLSVTASTSKTRSGGNLLPTQTYDNTTVSPQLRYNVDMWGGGAASYRATRASLAGSRYDLDRSRLALSANVASQYFQVLSTRARVATARENIALAERLLRIVDSRYRNGVARELDLSQQTTTVLQQRANLIPLEAQQRQNETALALLLGVTPQDFTIVGEPFEQILVPGVAPWTPSDLLLRRPDVATAEMSLASAHANIAVARAALLPGTISLTAGKTYVSPELASLADATRTFSIAGVLSIVESVFTFRAHQIQLANAHSNEVIALTNYASTIRTALKDVDDSLANVQTDARREDAQRATVQQAQRALTLAEAEYREGTGALQDVLSAQQSLFSAQDQLTQIRLSRLTSALDLYVALGGGWSEPAAD